MVNSEFNVKSWHEDMCRLHTGASISDLLMATLQDLYDSALLSWVAGGCLPLPTAPSQDDSWQDLPPFASWLLSSAPSGPAWGIEQGSGDSCWAMGDSGHEFWQDVSTFIAILNTVWAFA